MATNPPSTLPISYQIAAGLLHDSSWLEWSGVEWSDREAWLVSCVCIGVISPVHTACTVAYILSLPIYTHTCTHTPHTCTPQLVMGEDAVLTFSCTSVVEREEWTEAFRVLNQLAQPCGTPQQVPLPITGEDEERGEGRREGEVKLRVEFERA